MSSNGGGGGGGHHHHGNGCGCGHEHDDDHIKPGQGQQDTLFSQIDIENVTAKNEKYEGMVKSIFKPNDERNDEEKFVESDVDDQLIISIPFSGSVKLRSIILKCGPSEQTPEEIEIFSNKEDLDFENCSSGEILSQQKLSSIAVSREVIEYPLKTLKFNNVSKISLFISKSLGGETCRIYYINFKGEFLGKQSRSAPKNIVYESAPQIKDHSKIPGTQGNTFNLGS